MSAVAGWIDFATDFSDLIRDQSEWSQKVFGPDNVRGPAGPLKHMVKELEGELIPMIGQGVLKPMSDETKEFDEYLRKEFADLLILYLDAMRRAGFKIHDIVRVAIKKTDENKKREWPPFDPANVNEAVEHIRTVNCPVCKGAGGDCLFCSNGVVNEKDLCVICGWPPPHNPTCGNAQITFTMRSTTYKPGAQGTDEQYGDQPK